MQAFNTEEARRAHLESIAYGGTEAASEIVAEDALELMDERDALAALAARFVELTGFNFHDANGRRVSFDYDAKYLGETFRELDGLLDTYGCRPTEGAGKRLMDQGKF
jgi:hypothetical protein